MSEILKMTAPLDLPFLDPAFKRHSPAAVRAHSAEHGPLLPFKLPGGTPAWLVVDHSLVRTLLRDTRLVKSRAAVSDTAHPPAHPYVHPLFRHLLIMDPPEHTRLRNIMSRGLMLQDETKTHACLATACRDLIAELEARSGSAPAGVVDLVASFAVPLAQRTIAAIVGMPPIDAPLVARWAEDLVQADMEDPTHATAIAENISLYFERLAISPELPADSFCGYLSMMEASGSISAEEHRAMAFLMVSAGYETSAHLLGSALFLLLQNSVIWQALPRQDTLVQDAIDECLRLCSPLELSTPRFAREPITLAGRHIAAGDMVFMALAAANRDPELFPEPECFRTGRPGIRRHLAFGAGVHTCLGAALARMQAQVALIELARALPSMELAQDPAEAVWRPGMIMRGLERLPVRLRADAQ